MYYLLWIIPFFLCLVITLFPLRVESPLKGQWNVVDYFESFFEFILIACTFLLIVSNRTHDDMLNYQYTYIGALSSDFAKEPLYWGLRTLAFNMGLNFFQFRELMVLLSGICCVIAIKKANVKVSSVLLFYLPVMVFMDSIQFRNAICLYCLLLAIHLLNDKKNKVAFFLIVIALSQIHSAFTFYLILLVLYVEEEKRKAVIGGIMVVSLVVGMATFLNDNQVPFINDILSVLLSGSDDRHSRYSTAGKIGFLFPTFVHSFTLLLLLYLQNRICLFGKDRSLVKNITYLMMCSYVTVPFVMMNMNYYRILRNGYVISIIAFMILFREIRSDTYGKIVLFLGLSSVAALWGIFELNIYNTSESIFDPFFKDGVWLFDNETGVIQ